MAISFWQYTRYLQIWSPNFNRLLYLCICLQYYITFNFGHGSPSLQIVSDVLMSHLSIFSRFNCPCELISDSACNWPGLFWDYQRFAISSSLGNISVRLYDSKFSTAYQLFSEHFAINIILCFIEKDNLPRTFKQCSNFRNICKISTLPYKWMI